MARGRSNVSNSDSSDAIPIPPPIPPPQPSPTTQQIQPTQQTIPTLDLIVQQLATMNSRLQAVDTLTADVAALKAQITTHVGEAS